jgi:hypothetical protein
MEFINPNSNSPILLETFSEQMTDVKALRTIQKNIKDLFDTNAAIKNKVRSILGESTVDSIKSLLKK